MSYVIFYTDCLQYIKLKQKISNNHRYFCTYSIIYDGIDSSKYLPYTFPMKGKYVISLIVLLASLSVLPATPTPSNITSTYYPEPYLQFQYGPPSVLQNFSSSSTLLYPDDFIAMLGRVVIETDGNTLFDPSLIQMNISLDLTIEGYGRDPTSGMFVFAEVPVELRAISVVGGSVISSVIVEGTTINLAPNPGNVLKGTSSMITYLVLVNTSQGYDYFIPGTYYTLTDDSVIGNFGIAAEESGNQDPIDIPVSLEGSDPEDTAPFLPQTVDPTPDIPFEGEGYPFEHAFILSILSNPAYFDLAQAMITGNRIEIATVSLQVIDALPDHEYGVEIAFSSSDPLGFSVHLNGDLSEHGIPYRLYLGDSEIQNKQFTVWRNLFTNGTTIGEAQKSITVSVDPGTAIDEAPEGTYHDTVTVVVIPLDTL